MDSITQQAYDWARNQQYQSVAADYARTLAQYITRTSIAASAVEEQARSMRDALWSIANMQVTDTTDKAEVLALCMSIARLELAK